MPMPCWCGLVEDSWQPFPTPGLGQPLSCMRQSRVFGVRVVCMFAVALQDACPVPYFCAFSDLSCSLVI